MHCSTNLICSLLCHCILDVIDDTHKEDKTEKKAEAAAKEEHSLLRSRFKDDSKGELKPPTNENFLEVRRKCA